MDLAGVVQVFHHNFVSAFSTCSNDVLVQGFARMTKE